MLQHSYFKYVIDIKEYKIMEMVGRGGFGVVYKVQKNKKKFACKTISCDDDEKKCKMIIDREINILINVNHPTIIKFYGFSFKDTNDDNNISIIMEFAEKGSLATNLDKIQRSSMPEDYTNTSRQIILIGVSRALKYLHDRNIIHRDLKPGNVLLDEFYQPHVTDFGMSKIFEYGDSANQSQNGGTLFYMAPEVIQGEAYDRKADVYSFGILMYEVVTDCKPYSEIMKENGKMNEYSLTNKIVNENLRPKFKGPIKNSIKNLIEQCWSSYPDDRPTFTEIFNKLSKIKIENEEEEDDDENDDFLLEDIDKDRVSDYVSSVTKVTDKIDELDQKIEELERKNKQIEKQKNQLEKNNSKLQNDKESQSTILTKLSHDCEQLSTEKNSLESQIDDLKNYKNQLTVLNEELTRERNQLEIRFHAAITEKNTILAIKEDLAKSKEQLTNSNAELKAENEQIKEEKTQLTIQNEQINNEKEILFNENQHYKKDNENLRKVSISLEREKNYYKDDNEQMKKQIVQLTLENKQLSNTLQKIASAFEGHKINAIASSPDEIYTIKRENEIIKQHINIISFNLLPIHAQQSIISDIIRYTPENKIEHFYFQLNNLLIYLLKQYQFKPIRCLEILNYNEEQLISKMDDDFQIRILSEALEMLFANDVNDSKKFIKILKNFNDVSFLLNYPIISFNEFYDKVLDVKNSYLNECNFTLSIQINKIDLIFKNDENIQNLIFESSIKSIPSNSFEKCSSLTKVFFDDHSILNSIDDFAFYCCKSLTEISFPASLKMIGNSAFKNCSSLTNITIPSSVVKIGKNAFSHCTSLIKVYLPSALEIIDDYVFNGCTSLKRIKILSSVKSIGDYAFCECTSLKTITIPTSVNSIGMFAFRGCSSLSEVSIPSSITEINQSTFAGCESLEELELPLSLTLIDTSAFEDCESLFNINIPPSVLLINRFAFEGCESLEKVNLSSKTKYNKEAFPANTEIIVEGQRLKKYLFLCVIIIILLFYLFFF